MKADMRNNPEAIVIKFRSKYEFPTKMMFFQIDHIVQAFQVLRKSAFIDTMMLQAGFTDRKP